MAHVRRPARLVLWGLFVGAAAAVLAPVGPGAFVPLKMAIASADSIGNDVYVAVVVDFGSGSSVSTVSKCVPVPSTGRDSDALAASVGQSNVAYASSGLLCAIDNYPANGVQNCGQSVGSGNYDYWSYWHGTSGSWVYGNNGPAEQSVSSPSDDVEGWRFQVDEPDTSNDPPPAAPASYAQICNASTEVPPQGSEQPPATTATSTPPQTTATTMTSGGASPNPGPNPAVTPGTPPDVSVSPKLAGSGTTTSSGPETHAGTGGDTHPSSSSSPSAGSHPSSGSPSASKTPATALASPASHHDSGEGGENLLPILLVAALITVLGGLAFFRWRRRPAEE